MSMNKFIDIISSPMMNTGNIQRYSGTKMVEPESLSAHILESQMMGYMIINYMNNICGENLDKGLYLEKALHHDLEESMTGDVIRTLKYYNTDVHREIQNVATSVAEEIYTKYLGDTEGEMLQIWSTAKEGREGFILKLVDTLTVVNKVVREVDFFHNYYFLRVAYEVNIYTKDLLLSLDKKEGQYTEESLNYLRDVLKGALDVLRRILVEHEDIMLRYDIIDKSLLK